MPVNAEQSFLFWNRVPPGLPRGHPFLPKNWLPLLKFAMFQKTHFHPRGVAQMEKVHFRTGFVVTQIRALAQRGAQNSCPVTISKLFSRCFLLSAFVGWNWTHIVPKWPGQSTFACRIRGICHALNNFTYKTWISCLVAFDSRIYLSFLRLFYNETRAPALEFTLNT